MEAVIKQYSVLMETMEEVHRTTRDEYGLKAAGVLAVLEKFEIFFGLRLGHLLFGAAEETSKALQAKDTSVKEAVTAVSVTQAFCQRQRSDKAFDEFYVRVVTQAKDLQISEPKLPTYLKPLKRFGGSDPHQFDESEEFVLPVLAMESLLIKSAI